VFEKAQQKVREAEIFVGDLHRENLSPEQVAAYWSAMLNAGYSVIQALDGEVGLLRKTQRPNPLTIQSSAIGIRH